MTVKNRLKEIRCEKHMMQKDIAAFVGSNSRTISRIELGDRNPSLELALRLAECLDTTVEDLFRLDDY